MTVEEQITEKVNKYDQIISLKTSNILLSLIEHKPECGGRNLYSELTFPSTPTLTPTLTPTAYSGYDVLQTDQDVVSVVSAAQYEWRQYSVPITLDTVEQAVCSMANMLSEHVYAGDGTGKYIDGLAAMISQTRDNTYGGIDRTEWAFWRNKAYSADQRGTEKPNIIKQWAEFMMHLTRYEERPTAIIAGAKVFDLFVKQTDGKDSLNGVPVYFDNLVKPHLAYFVNTKFIKFSPHTTRNFTVLSRMDSDECFLLWAGNLTCSGAQFQGVYSLY